MGHPLVLISIYPKAPPLIVALPDESDTSKVSPSVPLTYPTKLGSVPGVKSIAVMVHTLLTKVEVTLTSTLEKVHVA